MPACILVARLEVSRPPGTRYPRVWLPAASYLAHPGTVQGQERQRQTTETSTPTCCQHQPAHSPTPRLSALTSTQTTSQASSAQGLEILLTRSTISSVRTQIRAPGSPTSVATTSTTNPPAPPHRTLAPPTPKPATRHLSLNFLCGNHCPQVSTKKEVRYCSQASGAKTSAG